MIFVIFVVVTATYFISAMGNYRSTGTHRVRNLLADAALESGRAHAFKVLQEHALESDHTLLDSPTPGDPDNLRQRDLFSCFASSWRMVFQADLSLEPGGVRPNGRPPVENVPDAGSTYTGLSGNQYDDQLTIPMLKVFNNDVGGNGEASHRTITDRHGARYFNVGWFDDAFRPVDPADQDTARYKLRYAVQIFDVAGLTKTNFYPETAYHLQDLDRDIPVAEMGLDPAVVAEPWGVGNAGDLRREFDMLRDRYAVSLASLMGETSYATRRFGGKGLRDPADTAIDRWLRWDPKVTEGSDAFVAKRGLDQARYYQPRPARLRHIKDVHSKNYQWHLVKNHSLMHYYTADDSGILPIGGGDYAKRYYYSPGPKSGFDIAQQMLVPGNAVQSGAANLRYSHIGEGLSRRRGDDVDTNLYYNILTMHDGTAFRVSHQWLSWLDVASNFRNPEQRVTGRGRRPYDLFPPAEGVPLDKDDNFGVSNADVGYVDGDEMHDHSYTDAGGGYYPMHEVVRHGDADGDGDQEYFVDADPDAPGYEPRFKNDSWMERTHLLGRHFYGLGGAEGKQLGPRMREYRTGGLMSDYSDRRVVTLADGTTRTEVLKEGTYQRAIVSPDFPYMNGAARKDHDNRDILVQDHYAWDIADALNISMNVVRQAWSGSGSPHDPQRRQSKGVFKQRAEARHKLRDIHAFHRMFLNALGEDVSTTAPFSGRERPENWIAQPGALAGRTLHYDGTGRGDNNWMITAFDHRAHELRTFRKDRWRDKHPRVLRVAHGANTAGMERLLNDVRISFFGASYVDENGVTQPIPPLDFNGDGFAESSLTGFNDGLVPKPAGYVHGVSQPRPYMDRAADADNPYHPFLASATGMPLKPFTCHGRLFMGKSHYFRVTVRGQLWDLARDRKAAERNVDLIYCVNPSDAAGSLFTEGPEVSGSPDLTDSHVIYQRMLVNQNRNVPGAN